MKKMTGQTMTEATADLTPLNITEIDPFIDLKAEIDRLRKERNAVILAHYYQSPEIQDIADFVGDSLDLSRKAANTDADVIAFCGVRFMAETAKILSPEKTVILPDMEAGCSLEDSCPPDEFKAFREAHPGHISLTYINCSAEVKALSDIIVTSSNAEDLINQIPEDHMTLWQGSCIVHELFSERELVKLKANTPGAPVAAHPECPEHILRHADHVGSTSSILRYVLENPADTFIIATEPHIIHQMQMRAPEKTFIGAPGDDGECNCNNCPFMELNTLEKLYLSLANMTPQIEVDEDIRVKALDSVQRMLDMSPAAKPIPDEAAA